jgi:hypothetical protein
MFISFGSAAGNGHRLEKIKPLIVGIIKGVFLNLARASSNPEESINLDWRKK